MSARLQAKEPQDLTALQLAEARAECDALRVELQKAHKACVRVVVPGRQGSCALLALSQVGLLLTYFVIEDFFLR